MEKASKRGAGPVRLTVPHQPQCQYDESHPTEGGCQPVDRIGESERNRQERSRNQERVSSRPAAPQPAVWARALASTRSSASTQK
jgi:hypothetical protein